MSKRQTKTYPAKNIPMILSYTAEHNGDFMQTDIADQIEISNSVTDEADAIFSVNFQAPINVLYNPTIFINKQPIQLQLQGWSQSTSSTIIKLINSLTEKLAAQNIVLDWDKQTFIDTTKIILYFDQQVTFQIKYSVLDDNQYRAYYLSKIFGVLPDEKEIEKNNNQFASKIYTSQQQDNHYVIAFEKQVYTNIAKTLNIVSYDINKYIYELKKQRFLALKATYNFEPGSIAYAQNSFSVSINTSNLSSGLACTLCDENYVPLILEQGYTITLNINTSARVILQNSQQIQKEDLEEQMKEQQKQQEQEQKQQQIQNQLQLLTKENNDNKWIMQIKEDQFQQPLSTERQQIYNQLKNEQNQIIQIQSNLSLNPQEQIQQQNQIKQLLIHMNELQNGNQRLIEDQNLRQQYNIKLQYNELSNKMIKFEDKGLPQRIQATYELNKSLPFPQQIQSLQQLKTNMLLIRQEDQQAKQNAAMIIQQSNNKLQEEMNEMKMFNMIEQQKKQQQQQPSEIPENVPQRIQFSKDTDFRENKPVQRMKKEIDYQQLPQEYQPQQQMPAPKPFNVDNPNNINKADIEQYGYNNIYKHYGETSKQSGKPYPYYEKGGMITKIITGPEDEKDDIDLPEGGTDSEEEKQQSKPSKDQKVKKEKFLWDDAGDT